MRGRNLIILGFAVLLGLVAVFLANTYFSGVEQREERAAEENRMARIVVASQDMAFGTPLTQTNLRLVNWPANSVPQGSFTDLAVAVKGGRVALRPITIGEPVLASKVSGDDGRATLASLLPEDQRAVSVPVNNVAGVAGFVRAGDVVDVMLTRQIPGEGATAADKMTNVVLENVLVLAVDQTKDENDTAAIVAKVATLQTDIYGAQKLTLAQQIGTLSLTLRNVENQTVGGTNVVVAKDLGGAGYYIGPKRAATVAAPAATYAPRPASTVRSGAPTSPRYRGPTMTVVRGTEGKEVPVSRSRGW
ncbi:Flp pilus assembly protein CpaB [Altererythrobacter sp. ZODW24]|uniref:Flp pilus assembly protein CpaB n=1 Tax=Altererythrobacter sp. ZODW24 TaxID=2185142 RepID=UPI000DF7D75C|nr:Flp pilus assembly protein CpaB [Altererythrobacter sp. ZODW24]